MSANRAVFDDLGIIGNELHRFQTLEEGMLAQLFGIVEMEDCF
jgi:hypothetical protein